MQLVILGKGDQKYEEFFHWAAQQYDGRMAVMLDYNEALSMAIYSGADLFLMPSKSEPCGLSQMIAMRYGTVPIVRETGGLRDTVQPYEAWRDAGTGFTFANYASGDMLYVICEAVQLYKEEPDAFARLRARAMSGDFSWARSAKDYLQIYTNITGGEAAAEESAAPAEEMAAPAEEKPVKKPRKAPAKKAASKKEEEPGEEKPVKKTTRKTAAKKAAEETVEEAPVKKTRKTAAKKTAEESVEEAPAKKTRKSAAAKDTTKKETVKKGTTRSKKKDLAE